MSKRSELAKRIAAFVSENKLTNPYGGEASQNHERKGKPYVVLFSQAANLDGVIIIFGEKFIQVKYTTRYHHLPHQDNRVFESEEDVINFLKRAFVDFDGEALNIPTKSSMSNLR